MLVPERKNVAFFHRVKFMSKFGSSTNFCMWSNDSDVNQFIQKPLFAIELLLDFIRAMFGICMYNAASVPDHVKADLLQRIRTFLDSVAL